MTNHKAVFYTRLFPLLIQIFEKMKEFPLFYADYLKILQNFKEKTSKMIELF